MTKRRRGSFVLHYKAPPSGIALCKNMQVGDDRMTDDRAQVTCGNCVKRLQILDVIERPDQAVRLVLANPDQPVHWTLGPCDRPRRADASNVPAYVTCGECLDLIDAQRQMLLVQFDEKIVEAGVKMHALAEQYSEARARLTGVEMSLKRIDMQGEHDELLLEAKRILMNDQSGPQELVRVQQLQQLAGALRKAMPPGECPMCKKGLLMHRRGPYGAFWGCSRYPECTYLEDRAEAG